jgi:hypothetical protein
MPTTEFLLKALYAIDMTNLAPNKLLMAIGQLVQICTIYKVERMENLIHATMTAYIDESIMTETDKDYCHKLLSTSLADAISTVLWAKNADW